jgi:hypothetical protein
VKEIDKEKCEGRGSRQDSMNAASNLGFPGVELLCRSRRSFTGRVRGAEGVECFGEKSEHATRNHWPSERGRGDF